MVPKLSLLFLAQVPLVYHCEFFVKGVGIYGLDIWALVVLLLRLILYILDLCCDLVAYLS